MSKIDTQLKSCYLDCRMDPQAAQETSSAGAKKALIFIVIVLVIIVLAGVGFLVFRGEPAPSEPKVVTGLERDSITIGYPISEAAIYPESQSEFYSQVISSNIFDGLSKLVNGQVKPNLVESWTNPDKNTWRFKLRKGVKFHNGDPFTASDVKFSIDQALKNEWPYSFSFSNIESVQVIDDFTVEIKTNGPDPILLNRLVYALIVSENQFKNRGKDPAVGTGPYKLVSLNKEELVLEANQGYFLGVPKVKKVVYKILPDAITDEEMVKEFNEGKLDLIRVRDSSKATAVIGTQQIKPLADPFITFLWFDTARDKSPYVDKTPNPLKNKLVRQAIYRAIDVSKVIKARGTSSAPASQFVTSSIFGFNPNIKRPEVNVEEAKKLMKQAGFEDGFSLTIDVIDDALASKVGGAVAAALKEINIEVKLNTASGDTFVDKWIVNKDTSAFIVDYGAETFDAGEIFTAVLYTQKDPLGASNLTNYSNPELDKLADDIAVTFDLKSRQKKLYEATAKAIEELPMIPLYSSEPSYIIRNNYDWTPTAFGAIYANEISGRQMVNQ